MENRCRVWRRVMVRLAYLGLDVVDVVDKIHIGDLECLRNGNGELTEEGKKRRGMFGIHFHQKINGIRRLDDDYLLRIEKCLDLREGSIKRGRWTDLVSGYPDV